MIVKTLTIRLDDENPKHLEVLKSLSFIKETFNIKTDSGAFIFSLANAISQHSKLESLSNDFDILENDYNSLISLLNDRNSINYEIDEILDCKRTVISHGGSNNA